MHDYFIKNESSFEVIFERECISFIETTIRTSNVNARIILKIADIIRSFRKLTSAIFSTEVVLGVDLKIPTRFLRLPLARPRCILSADHSPLFPLFLAHGFQSTLRDRGNLSRNIPPAFIIYEWQSKKLRVAHQFSLFVRSRCNCLSYQQCKVSFPLVTNAESLSLSLFL